jgi:hypothetical protein
MRGDWKDEARRFEHIDKAVIRRRFCDVSRCGDVAAVAYRDTGEFYCEEHRHPGDLGRCERDGCRHEVTTPDMMRREGSK